MIFLGKWFLRIFRRLVPATTVVKPRLSDQGEEAEAKKLLAEESSKAWTGPSKAVGLNYVRPVMSDLERRLSNRLSQKELDVHNLNAELETLKREVELHRDAISGLTEELESVIVEVEAAGIPQSVVKNVDYSSLAERVRWGLKRGKKTAKKRH